MSGLRVRRAGPADLDAVVGLLALLSGRPLQASAERRRQAYGEVLAVPGRHLLVAEDEGRAVGTVDGYVMPGLGDDCRPTMLLRTLVVDPDARGRGVGTALVRHLLDVAEAAGCAKVQLLCGRWREDTHRFYLGLGFEDVARGFVRRLD